MVKVEYSVRLWAKKKRKRSVETRVSIDRIRPQPPPERSGAKKSYELMQDMEEEQTQSVNPSEGDGDKKGKAKAVACKKNEAAANAQPVDLLPFLQREEKRPIRPRNPPIPVTPEVILPIDPFVTPEFPRFSRLAHWMDLRGIYRVPFYINGKEIEKEFFQKMDDAENNLNKEHINVAFEMLNCKRGCVGELVKGLIHPKKVWLEDVDVIYGVIEDKLSYHYIGMEIQLMDNTITLFHCGLTKANIKRALNQIQ
ncbi:unnamed protein product [Brassica napus]|uniref:(rape) hypothetical protein n=1 Tax=Brassica napus TaxID=3708 RepID=A0A816NYD4_BRANA|nr:unnamed protein product [Brassica napus]